MDTYLSKAQERNLERIDHLTEMLVEINYHSMMCPLLRQQLMEGKLLAEKLAEACRLILEEV